MTEPSVVFEMVLSYFQVGHTAATARNLGALGVFDLERERSIPSRCSRPDVVL